jgi:hypothetical protein
MRLHTHPSRQSPATIPLSRKYLDARSQLGRRVDVDTERLVDVRVRAALCDRSEHTCDEQQYMTIIIINITVVNEHTHTYAHTQQSVTLVGSTLIENLPPAPAGPPWPPPPMPKSRSVSGGGGVYVVISHTTPRHTHACTTQTPPHAPSQFMRSKSLICPRRCSGMRKLCAYEKRTRERTSKHNQDKIPTSLKT